MAYASQSGRARVSSTNPKAFGICDRCGFLYNHSDLQWQFDWAGASLINKKILVCDTCLDVPQEQLRAIILPADPEPIVNPRVENYAVYDRYNDRKRQSIDYAALRATCGACAAGCCASIGQQSVQCKVTCNICNGQWHDGYYRNVFESA
jgi:hypothetical protein